MTLEKKVPLIVANWKAYIGTEREARKTARALRANTQRLRGIEVAVAPPFPLIPVVAAEFRGSKLRVSAQAVSTHNTGAHTGEVTAPLLESLGVSHVIVGHSERRAAGETDESISEQVLRVSSATMRAVICVGEHERDRAGGEHFEYITGQIRVALSKLPKTGTPNIIVAYEPVWAIGKSAAGAIQPTDLRETAIFIRKTLTEQFGRAIGLSIPVLYGGSVDATNVGVLLMDGGVDGFLVGRASVEPASLVALAESCRATLKTKNR